MPKTTRPDADWKVPNVRMTRLAPLPEKPAAYLLRCYLVDGHYVEWDDYPDGLWRDILIGADATLDDLHYAIFTSFNRFDQHLYEFNLGKGPRDRKKTYLPSGDAGWSNEFDSEDTNVPLSELGLQIGRRFGYLFDFGDDWEHVIEVRNIHEQPPKGKLPKVVERHGKSPPQYPDVDE